MTYRALMRFADLRDGGRIYEAGEIFPREGLTVSDERLRELLGSDNRARKSLIVAIPDENGDAADQTEDSEFMPAPAAEDTRQQEDPEETTVAEEEEPVTEPPVEAVPVEKKRSRSRKKVSEDA